MDDLFESLSQLQGWDTPTSPFHAALLRNGVSADIASQLLLDPDIVKLLGPKKHKIKFDHASSIKLDETAEMHSSLGTFQTWTDVTGTGPPSPGTKGALQAVNFTKAIDAIKSLEERVLAWKSFTTAQMEILEMAKNECTEYMLQNAVAEDQVPMTGRMVYCMDSALMLQHKCAALVSAITGSLYIPMRIHILMVNPAHESCHAAYTNLFSAMDIAAKEALRAAHHAGMAAQSRGTGGKTPNEIVELLGALRVQYLHSLMVNGKYALSRHDWRRTYLLQETMLSWENLLSNSAMAIGSRVTETGQVSLESFGLTMKYSNLSDMAEQILFSATSLGDSGGGDCAWPNMASTGRVTETASMGSTFAQNAIHNIKCMTAVDQENTIKNILYQSKLKLDSANRLYNKLTLNAEKRALDRYTSAIQADIARSRSDTVFLALGDARATATEDADGRVQITGIYDPRLLNRSKLPILDRKNIYKLLIEDEFTHGTPFQEIIQDKLTCQIKERCLAIGEKARTYPGRRPADVDMTAICDAAAFAAIEAAAADAAKQAVEITNTDAAIAAATQAAHAAIAAIQLEDGQFEPELPKPKLKKRKISTLSDALAVAPLPKTKLSYAEKIELIKDSESYKKLQSGEYQFKELSEKTKRKFEESRLRTVRIDTLAEVDLRIQQLKAQIVSDAEFISQKIASELPHSSEEYFRKRQEVYESELAKHSLSRNDETRIRKEMYDHYYEEKKKIMELLHAE
jgi:hypothetical protein